MGEPKPKKPWWRPRVWWPAALLGVVAVHELSFGPAVYGVERGWLSTRVVFFVHPQLIPDSWGEASGLWPYNRWWQNLGRKHAGRPPRP